MKVPSSKELRKLTQELKRLDAKLKPSAGKLYRRILRSVVRQWTAISGDDSLERAICSWDVPRMLAITDGMVGQTYTTAACHFAAHQLAALVRKYPLD